MNEQTPERVCRDCGSLMEYGQLPAPIGPHTHVWACTNPLCGYRTWAAKPKNENKRRDLKGAKRVLEDSARLPVCEICGRSPAELPAGQTLEVHHAVEVSRGGAERDLDNLRWLCTEDHQYVTMRRKTYEKARVYAGNGNGKP